MLSTSAPTADSQWSPEDESSPICGTGRCDTNDKQCGTGRTQVTDHPLLSSPDLGSPNSDDSVLDSSESSGQFLPQEDEVSKSPTLHPVHSDPLLFANNSNLQRSHLRLSAAPRLESSRGSGRVERGEVASLSSASSTSNDLSGDGSSSAARPSVKISVSVKGNGSGEGVKPEQRKTLTTAASRKSGEKNNKGLTSSLGCTDVAKLRSRTSASGLDVSSPASVANNSSKTQPVVASGVVYSNKSNNRTSGGGSGGGGVTSGGGGVSSSVDSSEAESYNLRLTYKKGGEVVEVDSSAAESADRKTNSLDNLDNSLSDLSSTEETRAGSVESKSGTSTGEPVNSVTAGKIKGGKSGGRGKKKASSWYSTKSVLNPTYKSRHDDFKRIFKDVPKNERLIVDYSCALQKNILVQGRMYISHRWICFYANIFGVETSMLVSFKDIVRITKEKTALVFSNAVQISTREEKYFVTSLNSRDKTYLILTHLWQNAMLDISMSEAETWNMIHYCYGDDLGFGSEGTAAEYNYIEPSEEDKQLFKERIEAAETLVQVSDSVGINEEGKEVIDGRTVDVDVELSRVLGTVAVGDLNMSSEAELRTSPQPIITEKSGPALPLNLSFNEGSMTAGGSVDELTMNSSAPISRESSYVKSFKSSSTTAVKSVSQTHSVERSISSTATAERCPDPVVDYCNSHEHYSIGVVDEVFNFSVDNLFRHCLTDSQLYRDFVVAKRTFNVSHEPWPESPNSGDVKVRNISYTLSLNYAVGPKTAPTAEKQIMYPASKPGEFYLVDTECTSASLPYGENFYIVNRYCITRVTDSTARLRITSRINYRKSVWSIVKSIIDKNATSGLLESFGVMIAILRRESGKVLMNGDSVDEIMERVDAVDSAVSYAASHSSMSGVINRKSRSASTRSNLSMAPSSHHCNVGHSHDEGLMSGSVDQNSFISGNLYHIASRTLIFLMILLLACNVFLLYRLWTAKLAENEYMAYNNIPYEESYQQPNSADQSHHSTQSGGSGDRFLAIQQQISLQQRELDQIRIMLHTLELSVDQMKEAINILVSTIKQRQDL